MARPATLRVHLPEDGRIIPEGSSRATMAVTWLGHPMTVAGAGQSTAPLLQARAG